jgi:hypothetical protein
VALRNVNTTAQAIIARLEKFTWVIAVAMRKVARVAIATKKDKIFSSLKERRSFF